MVRDNGPGLLVEPFLSDAIAVLGLKNKRLGGAGACAVSPKESRVGKFRAFKWA